MGERKKYKGLISNYLPNNFNNLTNSYLCVTPEYTQPASLQIALYLMVCRCP